MSRYIFRRTLLSLPLLILIPFAVFVLMDLAPGDIATTLAGDTPTPGVIKQIRTELHLDDPLLKRFWDWFQGAIHGDFGHSLRTNESVSEMITKALGPTLSLVLLSLFIALVLGTAFGIIAGMHPKGFADRVVSVVSSILVAAPPFWVGLILVLVFALSLKWLPATGYQPLSAGVWEWLKYLIL